jgi:hypothetical protein
VSSATVLTSAILAALASCASAAQEPARTDKRVSADSRQIWVLTDQGGVASEAGLSGSGASDVVAYEISCAAGELRSAQRKLTAVIYGARAWTVRVSSPLASEDGAQMLKSALEDICKVE